MEQVAQSDTKSNRPTPGQIWYRQVYLASEHWQRLRKAILRLQPLCSNCSRDTHLNVHHLSYQRLWRERPDDLIVLCRACHRVAHQITSLHTERLFLDAARFNRAERVAARRDQLNRRRVKPRHRKGAAFADYAFHCLRAIRNGLATPQELNFVASNKSQIRRLRV